MSLRTWWLENRLRSVDGKLRQLRFAQKRVRDSENELHRAKGAGLPADQAQVREASLQTKRARLAHDIGVLVDEEDRLKDELRRRGVSLASH